MKKPEKFWTGIIDTRPHAEKVLKTASIAFIIVGLLALTPMLAEMKADLSVVILAVIMLVPALALLKTRSVWAVRALLVVYGLVYCSAALWFTASVMSGEMSMALASAPLLIVWMIPLLALSRTYKAAKFLRDDPRIDVPVEVFD